MGSDFYFSGIDNYYVMEQIVEHMITEHGAKTLNFVGGDISNQENHLRLLAYKDILEKYGIPVEEDK